MVLAKTSLEARALKSSVKAGARGGGGWDAAKPQPGMAVKSNVKASARGSGGGWDIGNHNESVTAVRLMLARATGSAHRGDGDSGSS
jgi:hypothetical protein